MKRIYTAVLLLVILCVSGNAQNIAEIAKSDPLLITGAIGTQNTYYYSSSGNGYSSPLNNSIYANLNISVYGINMPFSFFYSNNNTSFSYPHFSFNISPSYKDWTLHLGTRSMAFSNYIYNIPFTGAGLEFNNGKLRFGAFYGRLQKSINDDPTDPAARKPQYSRYGWGVKLGYGNSRNFIDLYFFRAKDRMGSIDERWYNVVQPQDNLAIGLKGRVSIKNYFSFSLNAATSIFSKDTRSSRLEVERLNNWDKVFTPRYSSLYRFAGDASLNFGYRNFHAMVTYKMVQPDYMTLGSNYISDNIQSVGASVGAGLFRGKVNLGGNFSWQEDNLSNRQLYTTKGFVYSANANLNLSDSFNAVLSYNGYRQLQSDGTAEVNDTTRVNRTMHSVTAAPNYTISRTNFTHMFGASYSFNMNKDLNPFNQGQGDITTHAFGLNYTLGATNIATDFNFGYNRQQSKGEESNFTTDMFSFGASRAFLKDKNLNLSANLSLSCNKIDTQRTISFGASINAGYTLKKVHLFSLSTSINKFNDYYIAEDLSYNGFDFQVSLNYSYSFTLWHIKRKADKEKTENKEKKSGK